MGNWFSSAVSAVLPANVRDALLQDQQHRHDDDIDSGEPAMKRAKVARTTDDDDDTMAVSTDFWPAANAPYVQLKPLTDEDVFITEFISTHKGFSGVIKQRYSDFHVTEVMPNGELAQLTTTVPPEGELPTNRGKLSFNKDAIDKLEGLLTLEEVEALVQMCYHPRKERVIVSCSDDRDERTRLHTLIKEVFPHLYSRTLTPDMDDPLMPAAVAEATADTASKGNSAATATATTTTSSSSSAGGDEARGYRLEVTREGSSVSKERVAPGFRHGGRRDDDRHSQGQYCHFTLCKENMDTNACVRLISRKLRCKPKELSYAGTKDKRAITTQRMCIRRVRAPRLACLNRCLRGMTLGDFKYENAYLRLGDHQGNRFEIVLRNCTGTDEQITQALTSLGTNGFINYFGMQRFGVCAVPTHAVGLAMLKRNFKQAIHLLLPPNARLHDGSDRACEHYHRTGDAHRALVMMPRKCDVERTILQTLEKQPNGFATALQTLPRLHRTLYMHAYQSMVWNRVVSLRLRTFGRKVLVGDLVYNKDVKFNIRAADQRKKHAVTVTAETLHKYTIHDVLMPIPGQDVPYPNNEVRDMYASVLAEDGLDIDNLPHYILECVLNGDLRYMITLPGNVTWRTMRYDDVTVPLLQSPIDRLQAAAEGKTLPDPNVPTGQYRALILGFTLDVSCYATMAIREVLKTPTDKAFQSALNAYSNKGGQGNGAKRNHRTNNNNNARSTR
ncbi:hypothetical protein PTSG_12299 [Salpingoeca rosetta]|uniref:TRUD domain-containing protein n=1 Tax=Salpingoeca rosetta (strain ATCC 50818 / BSB-021) TaxID=946362 RepID=F2UA62_SALR5|nr:uncharacterized protein PTSG_12299 [Salpingoeca rosetta]EGD73637.1 hypothetical protein PTSG_12299 [Salpingoeca rosetta]|eukprot:XP_004993918.1 hypothetical protein PTSG_12299 [Salpingoeca rosetta]